jgi:hypothetical protein
MKNAFGWENWKPEYRRLEAEYIVTGSGSQNVRKLCQVSGRLKPGGVRADATWQYCIRRTTVGVG